MSVNTDNTHNTEKIQAVDLFCGAGGLSTALALACEDLDQEVELFAVNHDDDAIATHKKNHPWATHHNAKVEELHPPSVTGSNDVDILIAAPECTSYSKARGGKPVTEQMRASPFHVLDWANKTNAKNILIENVPEFEKWGPVAEDGSPTRNGEVFETWVDMIHALGYSVEWKVLNAADYGDATSRERLFIVCQKNKRAEHPEPSHSKDGTTGTEEWRSAAEIIDWSDPGESIWQRSTPLVNNTMQRIAEGLRQYGGEEVQEYANVIAEIEKDDVSQLQEDVVPIEDVEEALETKNNPFLVEYQSVEHKDNVERQTQFCIPYILRQQSGGNPPHVESPLPTISKAAAIAKVESTPFTLSDPSVCREANSGSKERPTHTLTSKEHEEEAITPYLVPYYGERKNQSPRTHDIDDPFPTITATGSEPHVAEPFLIKYYGNSDEAALDEPLPTVTKKGRFALIIPRLYPLGVDIRYRMLQIDELVKATGFPDDYEFVGNKTSTKKQIGNAVPVNLGKSLCKKILTGNAPSLQSFTSPSNAPADD